MDRIQKLNERIDGLEKKIIGQPNWYIKSFPDDKPKLAGSIVFLGFVGLFITGMVLGWHWGWLVAIGIIGGITSLSIGSDGFS